MENNESQPSDTYETDLFIASQDNIPIDVADGLPPEFGSDDYNNDPRLDEERAVLESKQEEIARRQDTIEAHKARHPSTTYSELIDMLHAKGFKHVSMGTIARDIEAIEAGAMPWADKQLSGGLVAECKEIVIRFKTLIEQLTKDMEDAGPRDKPGYAKQIGELSMSIYYLKEQGATFNAIKQADKKYRKFLSSPEAQRKQAEFNK